MAYETIVGRNKDDFEKFGNKATGFIGKHIVGTGEDAHLTTKVFLDLLRPHVMLITGKRGYGKSYDAGIIAEEILMLPEQFKQNLSVIIVDTMGIYWGFKHPNEQQLKILKNWEMHPANFQNVKIYVPYKQIQEFEGAKIPIDGGITIAPYEFSAEDWLLAFNLKRTDPVGISLEKNVNILLVSEENFTIEDLLVKIKDDPDTNSEAKKALENMLTVASQWGIFGTEGIDIDQIAKSGQVTVFDVSHLRGTEAWSVRNLLVAILSRKIYQWRLIARKEEEIARMEKEDVKVSFPIVWLIIDEAHNFCGTEPSVSLNPLLTIAKQGREPGISLVVITQMPNKIHQDILSQVDIVISHRLTSRDDLQALHTIMQTYIEENLWKYISELPRWPGAAIVLDDNLEKIFTVNIRPRFSHHAGGTAEAI